LAKVYRIVHKDVGVAQVESEVGVGTTFLIALPRVEPPD